VANDFDYSPHITLSYIDNDAPMPLYNVVNIPLQFDSLCLAIGDDRYYFPIGEKNNGRDASEGISEEVRASERPSERASGLRGDDARSNSAHRDGTHIKEDDSKRAELRRWRTRAVSDIERGRSIRTFESDILTLGERANIQTALERSATTEQVKTIFRAAQDTPDYHWQDTDIMIKKQIADMRAKGVTKLKWLEHNGACEECMKNAGKIVDVGNLFPSGVYSVPNHDHCMCSIEEIYE
jgi:hypothetical protein